jgi:hypothetical protein
MAVRRSQVGTFGTYLQNFARSVDIVDDQTLNETRSIIYEYVQSELTAVSFEVVVSAWVDSTPGLKISWSSANRDFTTTFKGDDNKYTSHLAVSFDTGKPLWIVNQTREPLHSADSYIDLWSGVADLPPYRSAANQDLCTSIVIPMRRPNNRILGVIALESTAYLDKSEYDSRELELLADTLGVLMDLDNLNQLQTQGTRDAIRNLRNTRDNVVFPQIAKPQIFLAFSAGADQDVVGVLVEVLKQFENQMRIVQWDQIEDSGTITTHLAEEITTSRFGICYLSEPQESTDGYADNPNVLFEAGMLQALTSLSSQELSGWIPIREEKSPPAPFDFAGERMEVVPRGAGNRLNEARFRARLKTRIQNLLSG